MPAEEQLWWAGMGELWSARLITAYFNHVLSRSRPTDRLSASAESGVTTAPKAVMLDAQDFLVIKWGDSQTLPEMQVIGSLVD